MSLQHRSDCPINRAVELLGDRWTLLVLRDIRASGQAHFRSLLGNSRERISPSILSDRLQTLVAHGLLRRERCAGHRQKVSYLLTDAGRDLEPVLQLLADWAQRYCGDEPGAVNPNEGAGGEISVPTA